MTEKDELGNRMKGYEVSGARIGKFEKGIPIIGRIDGRAFHSFTRGLKRPYDERLSALMIEMTRFVCAETNALCAYTQSDEASFLWFTDSEESQIFFDGKVQKMNSLVAAMASVYFNKRVPDCLPEKADKFPQFDCRVFQIPEKGEVANYFVWRELDAVRNSVSMAAQAQFSPKTLFGKNSHEMREMLLSKNIVWSDYPDFFKKGTLIQKKKKLAKFSTEEIKNLPTQHEVRQNPDLMVERNVLEPLETPMFFRYVQNKIEVLFEGADAIAPPDTRNLGEGYDG